jgi:hypothetical protein
LEEAKIMSLNKKTIEQLGQMHKNLLLSLKKLNPHANPEDPILTPGAVMVGDKAFELKIRINTLVEKIFDEYKRLVDLEKLVNIDKSVGYMNDYITTQAVPYISGIGKPKFKLSFTPTYAKKAFTDLSASEYFQKWTADYKTWKTSKNKDPLKYLDLDIQFTNFYSILIKNLKVDS